MESSPSSTTSNLGSLGSALFFIVLAWAAAIATFPLHDNSFLTHLATGRLILDSGSVPSTDPYTFTAIGESWTVQSWLPSVLYASAERVAGDAGLRVLVLGVYVAAAGVLWRLTAAATSVFSRIGVLALALFVVTDLWSERPYMIAVVGLGFVALALDGRLRPWLLLPILWVWGNSHGSFPVATALVLVTAAGEWLDQRRASDVRGLDREVSVLRWTLAGTVAAVIGPLGFQLLLFPFQAVVAAGSFASIVEWNPPQYESFAERAFLVMVLAAFASVAKLASWRHALPALAFAGAALYAQRNVVFAVVVLVGVLAAAAPSLGTLRTTTRPRLGPVVALVSGLLAVLVGAVAVATPVSVSGGYPTRALAWLDQDPHLRGERLATEDFTGNLLEGLDGPRGGVFIDDRADMFPQDVFGDYVRLVDGKPDWQRILDRHDIAVVVWSRDRALGSLLAASPTWAVAYQDARWVVACRRDACRAGG